MDLRSTTRPLAEIAFYEGRLTSLGAVVPYMPNRVLRQFGMRQIIPLEPVSTHGDYYRQWENHVLAQQYRQPVVEGQPDYVDGYLPWYFSHSHPKVQNPERWIGPSSSKARPEDNHVECVSKRYLLFFFFIYYLYDIVINMYSFVVGEASVPCKDCRGDGIKLDTEGREALWKGL